MDKDAIKDALTPWQAGYDAGKAAGYDAGKAAGLDADAAKFILDDDAAKFIAEYAPDAPLYKQGILDGMFRMAVELCPLNRRHRRADHRCPFRGLPRPRRNY